MFLFTQYLYLWGSLFSTIIFILVYFLRKDLRRRMVHAGIAVGILGVFSEAIFFQDYWRPPLLFGLGIFGGIEDFLFGFTIGGVGSVLYEFILRKRLIKKYNSHLWIIPVLILSECLSLFVFFYLLKINSIYASAIGFIIPSLIIMAIRRDLIFEIIVSSILVGAILGLIEIMFLFFAPTYLENYYLLYGKAALLFNILPLTELLWGMAFGAIMDPLYDFEYGLAPANLRRRQKRK